MSVDLKKLLDLVPVFAGVVNPKVGNAAATIIQEAEAIIAAKKAADPSLTTDQIIAAGQAKWDANIAAATDLLNEGH